jgi:hypothetical protein
MCISKDGHPIRTLDEWREHASPKSAGQWKAYRSAMELGRAWIAAPWPEFPPEVADIFKNSEEFGSLIGWMGEPEALVHFDQRTGPRNTDLVVRATDIVGPPRQEDRFVISVEGKADEPFAQELDAAAKDAASRREDNPRSRGTERLTDLCMALFGKTIAQEPTLGTLGHQLVYAAVAALTSAKNAAASRAVLLVHEFRSAHTDSAKLAANADALDAFVRRLTGGESTKVEAGRLYEIPRIHGAPLFATDGETVTLLRLFLAKVVRTLE